MSSIVEYAREAVKPIVIEKLDFRQKKAALEGESRRYSRMLSSFSYGKVKAYFLSRGCTICGADSWVHIEMFGRSKEEWFKSFLELPNGIPSHDTFCDVFSRLDPEQFQSCLWGGPRRWPDWPKVKWWPLTVRRCAAPTTGPGASRPFTW